MAEDNLPKSIESEQIVIGNLIQSGSIFIIHEEKLSEDCFSVPKHKLVFAAMRALFRAGNHIDTISVMEQLKTNGSFDKIGGMSGLLEISNQSTSIGISTHVSIVLDRYETREIIRISNKALFDATKGQKINAEIIADLQRELSGTIDTNPTLSIKDLKKQFLAEIQGNVPSGVRMTGISEIDDMVTARNGNLVVIGARPSMGKSMFATTIQNNLANQGLPGLFQNLEMQTIEGWKRTAACRYSIDFSSLTKGNVVLDENIGSQLDDMFSLMDKLFFFDDSTGVNAISLKAKMMSIMVKVPLKYLIIDHGKLMKHNLLTGNKRSDEEIGATCNMLKEIAKDLDIFVILLWQLKRSTGDIIRMPTLSDLRGSGEIEEAVDIAMFIHRDDYYGIEGSEEGLTKVIVAKNRNGECGIAECRFNPKYSRFEDIKYARFSKYEDNFSGLEQTIVPNRTSKEVIF